MLLEFVKAKLMTKSGNFDCNKSNINWYIKNGCVDEYNKIIEKTNFLDESYSFSCRIYCILNNISDSPLCRHCNENLVKYKNSSKGFFQYCSSKCSANSDSTKEKYKSTNLNKYGVEYCTQAPFVREKIENTLFQNYGVVVPMKSLEIKQKVEDTNIERYGSKYGFGSVIVKDKVLKTNIERYGANVPNSNPEILKYLSDKDWLEKELLIKNTKTISEELGCSRTFINYWARIHEIENRIIIYSEEKDILDFLNSVGVDNIQNNIYGIIGNPIGKGRRQLDLYLPNIKLAIELNGVYWHSGDKDRHLEKLNLCKEKGIKLLQFWDYQWNEKIEICKSIIQSNLGLNERIYARKCSIIELSSLDYRNFLDENHLQGAVNSSVRYGLKCDEELVSVIGFSKSRYNKGYTWELIRYVNKCGINVIGGFSKLLKRFRIENCGSIISYCDLMVFDGKMYKESGFINIKNTNPGFFYAKGTQIVGREKLQKHKLKDILKDFDDSLTADQNLLSAGWDKVWNCGNGIWILD